MEPRMETTSVGVVGLGIVGGTIAERFREVGITVRGYDLYQGIGEPAHLSMCSVVFLCVPTPSTDGGRHDTTEVWSAVHAIEPHLAPEAVIAIKSTVPPGTTDELSSSFHNLEFASVPEFLVAARAAESLIRPDRIVIGARSAETAVNLADLMSRVAPQAPVIHVTPTEAELVKLCSNAMLAAKVSMANELAGACESYGVAWPRIQAVVGLDRRIGPDHLTVTSEKGFGGDCLPKDLDGLIAAAREAGYEATLLRSVARFNRRIRGQPAAAVGVDERAASR